MAKLPSLTVGEYLAFLGHSVAEANEIAMSTVRDLMQSNRLDAEVPLYDKTIPLDTTSLTPEGVVLMDDFEIECESGVEIARDGDGNPVGLAMTMKRGNLVRRGMVVKFKARYRHAGHIEAVEILREAGNDALRQHLAAQGILVTKKKETS